MADTERSATTILPLVGLIILSSAALLLPWYDYTFTSGSSDARPDGNTTDVRKESADFYAFRVEGHPNATAGVDAEDETLVLGALASGALGLSVVGLVVELAWGNRRWTRSFSIPLGYVGAAACFATLFWVWFTFPDTLAHHGVDRFFTSKRIEGQGFIRTTPLYAWVTEALTGFLFLGFVAAKYAGGPIDFTEVENVRKRVEPGGRGGEHARRAPKADPTDEP